LSPLGAANCSAKNAAAPLRGKIVRHQIGGEKLVKYETSIDPSRARASHRRKGIDTRLREMVVAPSRRRRTRRARATARRAALCSYRSRSRSPSPRCSSRIAPRIPTPRTHVSPDKPCSPPSDHCCTCSSKRLAANPPASSTKSPRARKRSAWRTPLSWATRGLRLRNRHQGTCTRPPRGARGMRPRHQGAGRLFEASEPPFHRDECLPRRERGRKTQPARVSGPTRGRCARRRK